MPMSHDLASLVQRIRTLLEQRGADPTTPLLTAMEHTLTDGYLAPLQQRVDAARAAA